MPPWFNTDDYFSDQFSSASVTVTSPEAAIQIFSELNNSKFPAHTAIYTDGSQVKTPVPSTSAALFIPSKGVLLSWKLRPEVEVIESELFAIREALSWSQTNLLVREKIVIYTDSQASVHLIKNRQPSCYLFLIFQIQCKIMSLTASHEVFIQYIPGHKGISGNETADQAARDAHSLRYRTITPMSKEELVRLAHDRVQASWNQSWLDNVNNSGKGQFLTTIKHEVSYWPWAHNNKRSIETALARLRTGHAGVRAHLARFKMCDSPLCTCGSPETIEHLLLHCPQHAPVRANLANTLARLNIPVTLQNLLGGGTYPSPIQYLIADAVATFLTATNWLIYVAALMVEHF